MIMSISIYAFYPETKGISLEEMDVLFRNKNERSVATRNGGGGDDNTSPDLEKNQSSTLNVVSTNAE